MVSFRPDLNDTRDTVPSLLSLATTVAKRATAILAMSVLGLLAGVGLWTATRSWHADSTFAPRSSTSTLSRVAGLAAQLGIGVPGLSPDESVAFYAELLRSRDLLRAVGLTRFTFDLGGLEEQSGESLEGSLVDLYTEETEPLEQRMLDVERKLRDDIRVSTDPGANIVRLRVGAEWSALAVQLNARMLELVNEFNTGRRQSQAESERVFVEQRMREAKEELESAEATLAKFMTENRRYQDSPRLIVEAGRLQRRIDLLQQLYVTLSQAFEQARIDEVRDTPVITIIDQPHIVRRGVAGFFLSGGLGGVLGLMIGLMIAFLGELVERERRSFPAEFAELAERLRAIGRHALRRRKHDVGGG